MIETFCNGLQIKPAAPGTFYTNSSMLSHSENTGYELLNDLERVSIEIKFTFLVQAFERHDYIRTFDVFHEIHGWPTAKKDIAGLFKADGAIHPKTFAIRRAITLRMNSVRLAYSQLSSDSEDSFTSDFCFHDLSSFRVCVCVCAGQQPVNEKLGSFARCVTA